MNIRLIDLSSQTDSIRNDLGKAISKVHQAGNYILGPRVKGFEKKWAEYCGAVQGTGVGSGTDALFLSLKLLGIGQGDEVIAPVLTAPPTAVAVSMTGAKPVFADIDSDSFLINPESIEERITEKTRAVIPVHLYGCPVNIDSIAEVVSSRIEIIEDASQAHGAKLGDRKVGSLGRAAAFSFYPTKNIGAFGDAGMVLTQEKKDHEILAAMRDYGRTAPHTVSMEGINSRLDELQAAILLVKLDHLDAWNNERRETAFRYSKAFSDLPVVCPVEPENTFHVFHQYVIRVKDREKFRKHLLSRGVETAVNYPKLVCDHPVFDSGKAFPAAREAVSELVSLPVWPGLGEEKIEIVIKAVREYFDKKK